MKKLGKNFWFFLFFCYGSIFFFDGVVNAAPEMLPTGTIVSAKLIAPGIAEVTISGPIEVIDLEHYTYKKIVKKGAGNKFALNLQEGKRFNFKFRDKDGNIYYALINPQMPANIGFVGSGIGFDCQDPQNCSFIVTL